VPEAICEATKIQQLGSAVLLVISVNWNILIDAMFYCFHSLNELKYREQFFNNEN
jgi:hypothetical protein